MTDREAAEQFESYWHGGDGLTRYAGASSLTDAVQTPSQTSRWPLDRAARPAAVFAGSEVYRPADGGERHCAVGDCRPSADAEIKCHAVGTEMTQLPERAARAMKPRGMSFTRNESEPPRARSAKC